MTREKNKSHLPVRLDRWLWAARFFKTRSMAAKAVSGGHVHVNGVRAKASRDVRIGDLLRITKRGYEQTVVVAGVQHRRGPAPEARLLYNETEASVQARDEARLLRSLASVPVRSPGKPTKKERRALRDFLGK